MLTQGIKIKDNNKEEHSLFVNCSGTKDMPLQDANAIFKQLLESKGIAYEGRRFLEIREYYDSEGNLRIVVV